LEEVYPGEKIIVWAHNAHISHDLISTSIGYFNSMGGWIAEAYRQELYTVGPYMYRGKAAYNNRRVYGVWPAWEGSIESIMYRTRRKFCFIDMLGQTKRRGNSWMFEEILAKDGGVTDFELVPRDQYDAILYVDTVNPPEYLESAEMTGLPVIEIPPVWPTGGSHSNGPGRLVSVNPSPESR
jgi:erythromycin esterase